MITGIWRSIDDKSGHEKAIIHVEQKPDGSFCGTILEVLAQPGKVPEEFCVNSPAPFTDQPIKGTQFLWGLHTDPKHPREFVGGKVLDPLNGHIYSAKIHLDDNGKKLTLRGYLGIALLGRSQVWHRQP
jgi:uncharacterized protein (DUF2147 family)